MMLVKNSKYNEGNSARNNNSNHKRKTYAI